MIDNHPGGKTMKNTKKANGIVCKKALLSLLMVIMLLLTCVFATLAAEGEDVSPPAIEEGGALNGSGAPFDGEGFPIKAYADGEDGDIDTPPTGDETENDGDEPSPGEGEGDPDPEPKEEKKDENKDEKKEETNEDKPPEFEIPDGSAYIEGDADTTYNNTAAKNAIQQAIDAALASSKEEITIIVRNGTYTGGITAIQTAKTDEEAEEEAKNPDNWLTLEEFMENVKSWRNENGI